MGGGGREKAKREGSSRRGEVGKGKRMKEDEGRVWGRWRKRKMGRENEGEGEDERKRKNRETQRKNKRLYIFFA